MSVKDLKGQIETYSIWLKNAKILYADNKDANLSKTEFVSMQFKHQAIGKIEILPKIINNLKELLKESEDKKQPRTESKCKKHIVSKCANYRNIYNCGRANESGCINCRFNMEF